MEAFLAFFFFTFTFALAGFWLYALVEVIQSNTTDSTQKIIWLLLVLLMPFIGTILYFNIGRRQLQSPMPTNEPAANEFV